MLDTRPSALHRELREAMEVSDKFLGREYEEEIKRYSTSGYRRDWATDGADDKENVPFEWISIFAPQLISGNPRVKARTRRQGQAGDVAKALQFALNRSIVDTNMVELNEKLFYDWAFRWAVSITVPEPKPGLEDFDDPPYRPVSKRVPTKHFLSDPLSLEMSEDRWRSHLVIQDREDIMDMASEEGSDWNRELIPQLSDDADLEKTARDERIHLKRGEIVYAEIWVPEHQLDEWKVDGKTIEPTPDKGYHGTIFTVAFNNVIESGEESPPKHYLRDPRPFWGPRTGPYTVSGAFLVPDQNKHLSPLSVAKPLIEELNAHRDALSENMARYKRGVAVSSMASDDLEETIKDFEDTAIFSLSNAEDLDKLVRPVEFMGATPQHLTHMDFLRNSVRAYMGIGEEQMGSAQPDVTATAASIANQSSNRRGSYLATKFIRFIEAILKKEAWYLEHDDRMIVDLGPEAANQIMDPETGMLIAKPIFQGGGPQPLEDYEIEIDVYSMAHTSEELERLMSQERLNIATAVVPMMPQTALFFDWESWLEREGERLNDPELGKLVDMDVVKQIAMIQLQGMVQPGQGGSQAPQPRVARDLLPANRKPGGYSNNARFGASNNMNGSPGAQAGGDSSGVQQSKGQ